jgi:hypothetical protein
MATFPGRHFVGAAGDTPALQFTSLPIVAAFKVYNETLGFRLG